VTVLYASHPAFLGHDTGDWHPERPARLQAVEDGIDAAGVREALVPFAPVPAPAEAVARVHPGRYLRALEELCVSGGGQIDPDTVVSEGSYEAALLAAGAGLEAIRRLDAGEGDAAFCAVRPPGHHATPARAMGFCLVNNVSVAAAHLADRGERVLVVDYDAHHGNGTQDAFYEDPRVTYVSIHEYPLYPGTGSLHETGRGAGDGTTVNVPVPAGTTGDVFRQAFDEVIAPLADAWQPTWLLVSAGFDAHRADPITGLGLSAGDYADLAAACQQLVPTGRAVYFLEGGYDRDGLASSAGATLATLAGVRHRPEVPTSGGPGSVVVDAVAGLRHERGWK
jgi:acetoin utilization deacetylase AcuC-like enzyme